MPDEIFDVAVVGYGPTGATLANLLAESGLRVLVLDREANAYHLPRAVHFDDETMRVFQTVGIADALSEKVVVNPGMRFVDDADELLLDWPRSQEIGPMGWYASYRLHQPDLEKLLRQRLSERVEAVICTNCEVTSVSETADHVALSVTDRTTDQPLQFAAKLVVGCDGARSLIRDAIGGGMEDLGFQERWLVVDLLLNKPRPDLGNFSIQFCNNVRPMTYCRSPANRRRWEITVLDGESDAEITAPERVWELLSRWITKEEAELERSAVYTFHSALAQKWRKGRLMIAGDAAHLTPPFMGQGMCTGIRDASNLAWKLAAVVQAKSEPELLNTYQAERAPHARQYIETAMRLGGLINAMDQERALKLSQGGGRIRSIQPKLGPSACILSTNEATDPVGQLFPQLTLRNGQRLDDFTGYRAFSASVEPSELECADGVAHLCGQDHPSILEHLEKLGAKSVLVGPDRYIQSVSKTCANDQPSNPAMENDNIESETAE